MASEETVRQLMALFEGFTEAHGTYDARSASARELGGKVEIKSTASTKREPVTLELWRQHVAGRRPLGVIPVRDNNTCLWGCVDVDVYDLQPQEICALIAENELPLVPCRTKSGGVHLFLFLSDPVSATVVQARLREMAVLMGQGTAEVFPKQTTVFWERGDLGSWLNMPYFGGDETDRYGYKPTGLAMTVEEFLAAAHAARCSERTLVEAQYRKKKVAGKDGKTVRGEPEFGDGPPCLQHLSAMGFPEGTRNKGLYNLATFAKKKFGSRWKESVEEWNRRLMAPPLPAQEVLSVIGSQEKKDVQYQCKEHPLSTYCNGSLCRTRKFGVGSEDDVPKISGMSVLKTIPPLWFVDVGDQRMELTTEQLQSYHLFHRACMEQMRVCYRGVRQDAWLTVVGAAMRDAVEIEVPPETGLPGQFKEILEDFLLNKHRGETSEDLLLGRPFSTLDADGELRHYFRLRDLRRALDLANFKIYNAGQITARLREMGAAPRFFNIKNKNGVNTYGVAADLFEAVPQLSLPAVEEAPI